MDNSRYGKRGILNETNRERKAYEEMLMFEYQMRTLQMKTCIVCRENSLQFKDKEELIRDGASVLECGDNEYSFVCDKCKRNKLGVDDMYHLESNLHPVWYERDQNGDFRFDNEGNKVARYDIPSELKNLTMAEKLLIRRCSPLIPSHHIKNGVYGIDGHCVCFPQNIDQMCSDLPQQQSNMVIFVRHISNRVTGSEHSRHYKVNKNRVLSALRWLKIHHIGYHDITITESNLDWIQGDNVYEPTKKYEFDTKYRKKDAVHNAEETVSSNQCGGNNDGQDEAGMETVHPNYKQNKPNPEQSEIIKSFKSTAEGTGQSHKVLDFPPIDHSEPLNEFDSEEQIFVNAYPWLFPGGIGDVYDRKRGKISNVHEWANHLIRYHDGRFLNDQMFCLYVFNMLQRHTNNTQGNFFYKNENFLGANVRPPPTVEELQEQVQSGDTSFISKLRYVAKGIRGSDSFWRGKTEELESWIDYHVSRGNGPPTHFITFSCAENWWPDLRRLMIELESEANNHSQVDLLKRNNHQAMCRSVKKYSLYVNQFFMIRSKVFLDTVVRNALEIEHYWARVEFAPGRGQIHLHLLGIGKDKSYMIEFHKAKSEDEKVEVLERYAENVLNMTADVDVDDKHVTDIAEDSNSPLRHRFCECYCRKEDARALCEECMIHICNNYCLRDNLKNLPRECHFGYGKETAYGQNHTTEGKPISTASAIVVCKRGLENFQMVRTKSRRVVQHSKTLLQGWRANCDIQLLIYRSHPNKPDLKEIEKVCQYVVAYAGKKNHTSKQEKEAMQNIIQSACSQDITGVQSLVKRSLNWMTSKRLIGIPEAVHEIDRLSLTICSDVITHVSLQSCFYKLKKKDDPDPKDLVTSYAKRDKQLSNMSLDRYFYKIWCKNNSHNDPHSKRKKNRILIPKGLDCKPRHPIDFNYARGMLLMHKPWSVDKPLNTRNKEATIHEFKRMLESREVPTYVWNEYNRAVFYSQQRRIKLVAKTGVIQGDVNMEDLSPEEADQHLNYLHSSQFTATMTDPLLVKNNTVDVGLNHDWATGFFVGSRDVKVPGEEYIEMLRKTKLERDEQENQDDVLYIPKRSNGEPYSIDLLSFEQRVIVLATVDTVVKFLLNDDDYKPLRATIMGMGGCGKSLIINTIICIIREMTKTNSSVQIAAPSGNAAWNVKGCTLHSLLGINVKCPWFSLDEERKETLREKLKDLLVLMVDERSMLSSHVTFGAEEHVRECAFNGNNSRERWGGIPAVLFFGDDYQLPPVDKKGAIHGFAKFKNNKQHSTMTYRNKGDQICEYEGWKLLSETMTGDVFKLTKNFRTKDEEDCNLMGRMRVGEQTPADAERLINLHLSYFPQSFRDELEDDPKTLWAYAKREDMTKKNIELLIKTQKRRKVPIARLKCHYKSNLKNGGTTTTYNSHFRSRKIQHQLDVCVGAQVCLETANFDPIAGLFIGAIGRVVDIVYDKSVGPNTSGQDQLPKYIVVDFPSFKPTNGVEVWDKNNPTHVPIAPYFMRCDKGCCSATFMPLQIAYAITIHRCQGLEAGFDEGDRWSRIVIDPSDTNWEIKHNLGTAYVSTSRGKTLGSKTQLHPKDSSIYWTGCNVSVNRLSNCKRKRNGQECESSKKRTKWVEHLETSAESTRQKFNKRKIDEISNTTLPLAMSSDFIKDRDDLRRRTADIINHPNSIWASAKTSYEIPRNYFD